MEAKALVEVVAERAAAVATKAAAAEEPVTRSHRLSADGSTICTLKVPEAIVTLTLARMKMVSLNLLTTDPKEAVS